MWRGLVFKSVIFVLLLLTICTTKASRLLDLRPIFKPKSFDTDSFIPLPIFPSKKKDTLNKRFFTDKMVDEIMERHNENFGPSNSLHLDTSLQQLSTSEFGYESRIYHGQFIYHSERTRDFGEYVFRKIMEYQLDKKLRSETQLRPIYKAKKAVTNYEVKSGKYMLIAKYSLSGNFFETKIINPWVDFKITIEMGKPNQGPTSVSESIISLEKNISKNRKISIEAKTEDGIISIIGKKQLRINFATSLTASTYLKKEGRTDREHLILAGLEWII